MQQNEQTLQQIHELKAQISALQAELDTLQNDIKLQMEADGCTEMTCGDFKVTYREHTTHRFDAKRFKAERAALYQQYLLEGKIRTFRVKHCA